MYICIILIALCSIYRIVNFHRIDKQYNICLLLIYIIKFYIRMNFVYCENEYKV